MTIHSSSNHYNKHGFFIRRPVVTLSYDNWDLFNEDRHLPQMKLLSLLNPKAFKRVKDFRKGKLEGCDGVYFPYYINPFYFVKHIRHTYHLFDDENCLIESIEVFATIGQYNEVGGYCDKEDSVVTFKDGKKIKLRTDQKVEGTRFRSMHFYYNHLIKQIESNKALQKMLSMGKVPTGLD